MDVVKLICKVLYVYVVGFCLCYLVVFGFVYGYWLFWLIVLLLNGVVGLFEMELWMIVK